MKLETVRKYYKPIQPTVSINNEDIIYKEIQPEKEIEDFVYCFWQLKTKKVLSQDFNYLVVSDGCIDIFFENKHPNESFIMGFCRRYTEFNIGREFNYIGVRFLPTAFPLLFRISAKTLSNKSQELRKVNLEIHDWICSEIKSRDDFNDICDIMNKKLSEVIQNQQVKLDQRFFKALICIFQKKGFLDIEKDLDTGLSSRQLRRIFEYYIGTTAKSFSNVIRFQYILNSIPLKQNLSNNKLYLDVGFFDQAHFIKNFKTFYGLTPFEACR